MTASRCYGDGACVRGHVILVCDAAYTKSYYSTSGIASLNFTCLVIYISTFAVLHIVEQSHCLYTEKTVLVVFNNTMLVTIRHKLQK